MNESIQLLSHKSIVIARINLETNWMLSPSNVQ